MTVDEIRTTLNKSLHQWVKDPSARVQIVRVSDLQSVPGQYLVCPNGTINLRTFGVVKIAGKTVTEARAAIQDHLKQYLDSPELSVDVVAYNNKAYYIITQGGGLGDKVRRLPITGNDTVLDAINRLGLSEVYSIKIWIARRDSQNVGCQQILPVDWKSITQGAQTATNYQLLPGDRLYISLEAVRQEEGASLGPDSIQTMGHNSNPARNGF